MLREFFVGFVLREVISIGKGNIARPFDYGRAKVLVCPYNHEFF